MRICEAGFYNLSYNQAALENKPPKVFLHLFICNDFNVHFFKQDVGMHSVEVTDRLLNFQTSSSCQQNWQSTAALPHATVLFLFQAVDPQPLFSAFSRPLSLFPPSTLSSNAETSQTPATPVFGGSSEVVNRSRPPAVKL